MDANQTVNLARVAGTVATQPTLTNRCGESFYSFTLSIKRLSGVVDTLPVRIHEYLVEHISKGDQIALEGQIRTYQKFAEGKNHLMIIFLATEVLRYEKDINLINLTGYLCVNPRYRVTPLGREICDLMLAVKNSQDKSDYIPCVIWDRRSKVASDFTVGTKLKVVGRMQSRLYTKTLSDGSTKEKIAYELSVSSIVKEK